MLSGTTSILTEHLPITISEIVLNKLDVKVWSFDFELQQFTLHKIVEYNLLLSNNSKEQCNGALIVYDGSVDPLITQRDQRLFTNFDKHITAMCQAEQCLFVKYEAMPSSVATLYTRWWEADLFSTNASMYSLKLDGASNLIANNVLIAI